MQGTEGQTTLRQMGIKGGMAEGEDTRSGRKALHSGQQTAQLMQHHSAAFVARMSKG